MKIVLGAFCTGGGFGGAGGGTAVRSCRKRTGEVIAKGAALTGNDMGGAAGLVRRGGTPTTVGMSQNCTF